jgi:hypothetical protein
MDIPAIYTVFRGGEVRSAPVRMDGMKFTFVSDPAKRSYIGENADERSSVVVVDVKGFTKGKIDDRLLMTMRFPGNDVWFLTYVEDIEDVFDCFMGDIEKLLIPYHTTISKHVMAEAFDVSENVIPVIFAPQGRAICRGGSTKDIITAIEEMTKIGFEEIAVLDTDSVLRIDDWISLNDRTRGLIPFVRYKNVALSNAGIKKIIYDL